MIENHIAKIASLTCIGKRENLYKIDRKIMIEISVTSFILALSIALLIFFLFIFLNMLFIVTIVSFSFYFNKMVCCNLLCTTMEMYKLHCKMIENTPWYVISLYKICFR